MKPLRLNNLDTVPPKIFPWQDRGWAYVQAEIPEPQGRIQASSWKELLVAIKRFRVSNSLPIELLFDDNIEQWIAARVPQNFTALHNGSPNITVAKTEWPAWAKSIALLKNDEDIGVGQTAERVLGPLGGDKFKEWFQKMTGRPCGCGERRDLWNAQYPYDLA